MFRLRNLLLVSLACWDLLCVHHCIAVPAQDGSCLKVFSLDEALQNEKVFIDDSKPDSYRIFIHRSLHAGITGKLEGGQLTFTILTRDDSGGFLKPYLRSSELMQRMMDHFGERVKSIKAQWTSNFARTNLEMLNSALMSGSTLDEAIFSTWTGSQMIKFGFVAIKEPQIDRDSDVVYSAVVVFVKR